MNALTSLNDLIISTQELYRKYNISAFEQEISSAFGSIGLDYKKLDMLVQNESDFVESEFIQKDIPDEVIYDCIKKYAEIRKKYGYEKYVKLGYKLRKKFLDERKNYVFIKNSTISSGLDDLQKLNADYNEQYSTCMWLDRSLKKVYPETFTIKYEDSDSKIKTIRVQHKKLEMDDAYIEAPLIDRIVGTTVFDSFLLHSFYDADAKKWKYVPVKLIICIENNGGDTPDEKCNDDIFEDGD